MKTIALIHTVKSVAVNFDKEIHDDLSEPVKIYNLLDDFLALHPNEVGVFTPQNKARFYNDLQNAQWTGADLIVVTCSSLTPMVEELRPLFPIPIMAMDDAMGEKAVEVGRRIFVLATAESTVKPTKAKLTKEALKIGKSINVESKVIKEAFLALKNQEMERHDALVLEVAKDIKEVDVIVLAQASMAHLEEQIARETGIVVLSSPKLCLTALKKKLIDLP